MMKKTENRVKTQFKICYNKLINQTNYFPDDEQCYAMKCNKKSLKFKNEGNTFYANKELERARKCFSQALVFAEQGSDLYGMALANRSAAYFESGFYQECILDIKDCLNSSYNQGRRAKLYERVNKCEERITNGEQKLPSLPVLLPTLNNKNSNIFGASSSVELAYSVMDGRHIVAAETIEPGEILFIEPAFAFAQIFQSEDHFIDVSKCSHCLESISRCVPCNTCSICLYCSSKCRDDSWSEGHRWECAGMKYGFWYKIGLGYTAFRTLTKGIPSKFEILSDITETRKVFGTGYKYFDGLESHLDDMKYDTIKKLCDISAQIVRYLELKTDFLTHIREIGFEEDIANVDYIGFLLVKHLAQLSCNGSIIEHSIPEISHIDQFIDRTSHIASGVYPAESLMNHSCKSNIVISFIGKHIIVKAVEHIPKRAQIYNSYGVDYRFSEKEERQEQLKTLYYFNCNCVICSDESKEFRNLDCINCSECNERIYLPIRKMEFITNCSNCNASIENFDTCKDYSVLKFPRNIARTHQLNLKKFAQLFHIELEKGNFLPALDYLSSYSKCLKARVGCYHMDYGMALFEKIESIMKKRDEALERINTFDKYMKIHSQVETYLDEIKLIFEINYPYYNKIEPLQILLYKFQML